MPQALVLERTVNAPSDLVWKALSDPGLIKQWLPFLKDFKAEVGFKTSFLLGPDERKYMHIVEVKTVEPGKKLSHTWQYEDYAGQGLVTYELEPEGDKTKLTLTYDILEPFPSDNDDFSIKNFTAGWTYTIDGLKKYAENMT